MTSLAFSFWKLLLNGPPEPKEEHIARAITQEYGYEAPVALSDAVLGQKCPEGVGCVVEAPVVPMVL